MDTFETSRISVRDVRARARVVISSLSDAFFFPHPWAKPLLRHSLPRGTVQVQPKTTLRERFDFSFSDLSIHSSWSVAYPECNSRNLSRVFNRENQSREKSRNCEPYFESPLEAAAPDGRNRRRKKRFALYGAPREHVDYWTLRVVLGPGPPSERRMFTHRVPAFATIDRRERDHLAGYYITWYNCNNIATQLLHSPFVMQWWVGYCTLDCLYAIRKKNERSTIVCKDNGMIIVWQSPHECALN